MIIDESINLDILPRVLIVGQTFTTDTGGGITLGNLFKNWPKSKLAVAVESKEDVDFDRADNYYRIGFNELKMPFPFHIFQRKTKSGAITNKISVGQNKISDTKGFKYKLKLYFDKILHFAGLFFWMYGNEQVNDALFAWIDNFKPDVIYYQPNSYKSIDFVLNIQKRCNLPLVSHVMDDWFSFSVHNGPFNTYWQNKLNKKANLLFASTTLHLSICDYMSQAFKKRYGYNFMAFHNSVDLSFWSGASHKGQLNNPVLILYAGRVGYGLEDILLRVADAIEKLGCKGANICLEIQTKDQKHALIDTLRKYKHVNVTKAIPYGKLPEKFAQADVLLIPSDFDGPGLKFIKYSMPTKVSEYMAVGTPILVIAPAGTALAEYAKEGWAMVCQRNDEISIQQAIAELLNSERLKNSVTKISKDLVLQNHEEKIVTNKFRTVLSNLVKEPANAQS